MRKPDAGLDLARMPGVFVARLDVQEHRSISSAIHAGIEHFGHVDALVNNAGVGLFAAHETCRDGTFRAFKTAS
jgi:NADP-dependent 3-hydroxy acid dehydrogenase YdfG